MKKEELIEKAISAMESAYAPYSGFNVGASLLGKSGKVYSGCNVENSSFGAANCAERTAVFSAISQGEREFLSIAIVGGKNGNITNYCPPCGVCRQVLSEFCDNEFEIYLYNGENIETYTLGKLLPVLFDLD